jgi:Leucine rich repeat
LDSYPLLQHLILSHNLIFDIEDDALGRLEILTTLFLDHNQLTRIPTSLPSSLVQLHLSANAISDIQPAVFAHLTSLLTLNLSGNRIGYLQELPLPNLVTLDMREGTLHGVSQAVVATSPKLKDLLLDGNPVKCADLLGIAAWASPCREEKLFATPALAVPAVEQNFYFIRNTNQHCKRCEKHQRDKTEFRSINCLQTKIIATSNQLPANEQANGAMLPPATVPTNNNDNNYTNSGNENENSKIITFSNQLGEKVASTGTTKYDDNNNNNNTSDDAGRKINDNEDGIHTKELTTTRTRMAGAKAAAEAGITTKETNDKSFDVINQFSERLSPTTDAGGVTPTIGTALAHTVAATTKAKTQSHLLQFNDRKIGDNDKTDTEITKGTTTTTTRTNTENNNDNKKKQQPMEELNFDMLPSSSSSSTTQTVLLNDKTNDNKTFASTDKSDVLQAKSKLAEAGVVGASTTVERRHGSEMPAKLHIYENDGQKQQQDGEQEQRRRWQWLHKDQAFGNKAGECDKWMYTVELSPFYCDVVFGSGFNTGFCVYRYQSMEAGEGMEGRASVFFFAN